MDFYNYPLRRVCVLTGRVMARGPWFTKHSKWQDNHAEARKLRIKLDGLEVAASGGLQRDLALKKKWKMHVVGGEESKWTTRDERRTLSFTILLPFFFFCFPSYRRRHRILSKP